MSRSPRAAPSRQIHSVIYNPIIINMLHRHVQAGISAAARVDRVDSTFGPMIRWQRAGILSLTGTWSWLDGSPGTGELEVCSPLS